MILIDYNNFVFINFYNLLRTAQINSNDFLKKKKYSRGLFFDVVYNIFDICLRNNNYGKIVLCLENKSWRKRYFKGYKANRAREKMKNEELFDSIYDTSKQVLDLLKNCGVISVSFDFCEGDDVIALLSQHFNNEKILIVSNDKDIRQLINENISIFSFHDYRFRNYRNFPQRAREQLLEDLLYRGDSSDGIPSVLRNVEFSEEFLTFLRKKGKGDITPYEFEHMNDDEKDILTFEFNIYEEWMIGKNKGKPKSTKLFFKRLILSKRNLDKMKSGKWDDRLIKENIERNRILTDFDYIPNDVKSKALEIIKQIDFNGEYANLEEYANVEKIKRLVGGSRFLLQTIFQFILIQQNKEKLYGNQR